jgi:DNA-binding HxlR family transcriptional regulator
MLCAVATHVESGDVSPDAMTVLPPLDDYDRSAPDGWCPLERTLELIGTYSAMVLLREVFYGVRRFDDLTRRAGVTESITAKRLQQLVEGGLLDRSPYREQGQRTRYEYVLTERGRELYPIVVALMRFGAGLPHEHKTRISLTHADCGAEIVPEVRCAAGHEVPIGEAVAQVVTLTGKPVGDRR